jgi:hypothetical protein
VVVAPNVALGCDGRKATSSARDASTGSAIEAGPVDAGRDSAGPEAANELDVQRYEDEKSEDHVPLTVKTPFANVYRSYPKGELVTTLKAGSAVVQLAERNGFYRVTFDAPYPPARRLMGWMPKFIFDDAMAAAMLRDGGVDAGGKKAFCKVELQEFPVMQDIARRDVHCAYVCKDDLECARASAVCEAAIVLEPSGQVNASTQYTTVCTDAGAPVGDGGRKVPSLFGVPHLGDGKCPAKYVPAPKIGSYCFRSCKADSDCPSNATCRLSDTKEAKLCHVNN